MFPCQSFVGDNRRCFCSLHRGGGIGTHRPTRPPLAPPPPQESGDRPRRLPPPQPVEQSPRIVRAEQWVELRGSRYRRREPRAEPRRELRGVNYRLLQPNQQRQHQPRPLRLPRPDVPPQPRPQPQPQPAQRRPPTLLDLPAGCITNVGSYLTKTNAGLATVGLTASVGSWVSAGRAGRNPRPNDVSIAMLAAFERYPAEALREISRDNLVKIVRRDDGMTGKWNWNPVAGRRRGHVMVRTQTNQCYLAPDGGGGGRRSTRST